MEGIPITVKDSVNVKGYVSTHGTSFIKDLALEDDYSVAKLRKQGALILGKTNMHEIGLGTTGYNKYHGTARNPYNLKHHTGGSSSGSAASVASGLVPLSVGTDGGGSIRIPSSLCGVVGLKPSFGRIDMKSSQAASVTMIGPIGATVEDVAIGYSIMSDAPIPFDDVTNVRIGIFKPHILDATPSIINATFSAIQYYQKKGATIVEISIPHIQEIHMSHLITILSEMTQYHDGDYQDYIAEFAYDTQILFEIGRYLKSRDYISAQRVRSYAMKLFDDIFSNVDVILSPGTGTLAPLISDGEMDLVRTTNLMKYSIVGNFLGIPAIVFPIGYDGGLPIALQLQGRHWEEGLLLSLARVGEGILEREGPDYFVDVVKEAKDFA